MTIHPHLSHYFVSEPPIKPLMNYLIKIDDDYKLITHCFLTQLQLEKIMNNYYSKFTIEITTLETHYPNFLKMFVHDNSFIINSNIVPSEFKSQLHNWDRVCEYFNKQSNNKLYGKIINLPDKTCIQSSGFKSGKDLNLELTSGLRLKSDRDMDGNWSLDYNSDLKYKDDLLTMANTKFNAPTSDASNYSPNLLINEMDVLRNHFPISSDNISDDNSVKPISNGIYSSYDFLAVVDGISVSKWKIYFNNQFGQITMIDLSNDYIGNSSKIALLFPELTSIGIVQSDHEQFSQIQKMTNDIFVNVADASSQVKSLLCDKIVDHKLTSEEIKKLIGKYFEIGTNSENIVKFTNIWETICEKIEVKDPYINYIKRQLPNILTELGLSKKRLSDGIYWYGLIKKKQQQDVLAVGSETFLNKTIKDDPISDEEYESFIQKRKNGETNYSSGYKTIHDNILTKIKNMTEKLLS
jgi:hypothetical protein